MTCLRQEVFYVQRAAWYAMRDHTNAMEMMVIMLVSCSCVRRARRQLLLHVRLATSGLYHSVQYFSDDRK